MNLLPPSTLQRLTRRRLVVRQAAASTGIGERRSRAKGTGIEFADHRPYQLGDDIRHLDRHVLARLGEHYIRQFSLYQQLPVTILLDASASMRFGQPDKFGVARALTAGLGYVALAGGDRVQVGAFSGDQVVWLPPLHGVGRAPTLFAWLKGISPHHITNLTAAAQQAIERLRPRGLLIIVSDWWMSNLEPALRIFDASQQELVAVQVTAPEEEEPERLGVRDMRMVDVETGHEVELSLDAAAISRYRRDFGVWKREVRDAVQAHRGVLLGVRSDADLEQVLVHDWRVAGLIT